ncbi:MAG: YfcC family protein [Spirochaetia bacterium]
MGKESQVKIGLRAFLGAAIILLCLMIVSGILTKVLPAGSYEREIENGRTLIVPGSFEFETNPEYPFWRWITAPLEVVFASDNLALITIIIFLLFVGGSIAILEHAEVMSFLIAKLVGKFKKRKYLLMKIIIFMFMFLASFLGIYEGMVPLIIFIVPLAHSLGWDSLTGLGLSLLPMAFGFASSVTNPFTIGVAQKIADLPLFSGAWLRVLFFIIVYLSVYFFVSRYAKKIEKDPEESLVHAEEESRMNLDQGDEMKDYSSTKKGMHRAVLWFSVCMGFAITMVLLASVVPAMSDLAFPLMGLFFFIGGIGGGLLAGLSKKEVAASFFKGWGNMAPGVLLILMAYSVKYIVDQGGITDTILYYAASSIQGAPVLSAAFLIYLLTLAMNFFIGSASAKAFLMMPILTPLADLVGITRQTAVLAFGFGDGFSNMLFPSNALLLIALSFTVVSYPKWIRWTIPLQILMAVLSCLFIVFAVLIGYGPF